MNVPCSPTPAGPLRSATAALWCGLPPNGRRRLPRQILISGLNHTARSLAVYASQSGLLHRHARLASGWLANLSGRGWLPAGSQRKVSGHLILLSQASPGAPISPYRNQAYLSARCRMRADCAHQDRSENYRKTCKFHSLLSLALIPRLSCNPGGRD
jgi:hypothetical protein